MEIKHLLFDLDNTLYPSTSEMDAGISRRMLECVAEFFNCNLDQAAEIRQERYTGYSTTLEWLRSEGFSNVEGFLSYVHPNNEADELQKQPELRALLKSLNYPKSILTNAPHEHAIRVLKKLEVTDLFEEITDIRDVNYYGKPYRKAFEIALEKAGASIETTLFIDDMVKYTDGWNALGGTAVLIGDKNGLPLDEGSMAMEKIPKEQWGQTLKIDSIYDLPDLIEKLKK